MRNKDFAFLAARLESLKHKFLSTEDMPARRMLIAEMSSVIDEISQHIQRHLHEWKMHTRRT